MMESLSAVIRHLESACSCYRRAENSNANAITAAKNSNGMFFKRTNRMTANRARKHASNEIIRGSNELRFGFANIPPECPLRQRFPELMADVVSSIPNFVSSRGGDDDLTEIIHQYEQLCRQQIRLLLNVQQTIQHKHRITVYEKQFGYDPYTRRKYEDIATDIYLDHKDEILQAVFGLPLTLTLPKKIYGDNTTDNVVARMVKMDREMHKSVWAHPSSATAVPVAVTAAPTSREQEERNLRRAIEASMNDVATRF